MLNHKFDRYGSLASECKRCRIEFALAHDHQGWVGKPCKPTAYSVSEKTAIVAAYNEHFPY